MQNDDNENDDTDGSKETPGGRDLGVLPVPVFLNIICSLLAGKSKPDCTQKAKLMQTLVDRYLDRESIRVTGKKADKVKQILVKLKKLAWDGLADTEGPRKMFSKVSYF